MALPTRTDSAMARSQSGDAIGSTRYGMLVSVWSGLKQATILGTSQLPAHSGDDLLTNGLCHLGNNGVAELTICLRIRHHDPFVIREAHQKRTFPRRETPRGLRPLLNEDFRSVLVVPSAQRPRDPVWVRYPEAKAIPLQPMALGILLQIRPQ